MPISPKLKPKRLKFAVSIFFVRRLGGLPSNCEKEKDDLTFKFLYIFSIPPKYEEKKWREWEIENEEWRKLRLASVRFRIRFLLNRSAILNRTKWCNNRFLFLMMLIGFWSITEPKPIYPNLGSVLFWQIGLMFYVRHILNYLYILSFYLRN